MRKFQHFLESLRTENNGSLIEHIQHGFRACFEVESEDDLTWEEMEELEEWRKKPKSADREKNSIVPKNNTPPKNKAQIKSDLIAELGGYFKINRQGGLGWMLFQKELNKRLFKAGL